MDTHPQISDSLHRSEVFKGLTSEQFTGLLKKGRRIKLQPKSILFNQGDPAKSCVFVNRGRLKLTKLNEQGKEVILRYIVYRRIDRRHCRPQELDVSGHC